MSKSTVVFCSIYALKHQIRQVNAAAAIIRYPIVIIGFDLHLAFHRMEQCLMLVQAVNQEVAADFLADKGPL